MNEKLIREAVKGITEQYGIDEKHQVNDWLQTLVNFANSALSVEGVPERTPCYMKEFPNDNRTCKSRGHQLCASCYRNEAIDQILPILLKSRKECEKKNQRIAELERVYKLSVASEVRLQNKIGELEKNQYSAQDLVDVWEHKKMPHEIDHKHSLAKVSKEELTKVIQGCINLDFNAKGIVQAILDMMKKKGGEVNKRILGFAVGLFLIPILMGVCVIVFVLAVTLPITCFLRPDCIKFKGKNIF